MSRTRQHDKSLRDTLDHSIDGGLDDCAWNQTTLGVKKGGLGLRSAKSIALPAFVASRLAARPYVNEMAAHMETLNAGATQAIMQAYDKRTDEALARIADTMETQLCQWLIDDARKLCVSAMYEWPRLFDSNDGND